MWLFIEVRAWRKAILTEGLPQKCWNIYEEGLRPKGQTIFQHVIIHVFAVLSVCSCLVKNYEVRPVIADLFEKDFIRNVQENVKPVSSSPISDKHAFGYLDFGSVRTFNIVVRLCTGDGEMYFGVQEKNQMFSWQDGEWWELGGWCRIYDRCQVACSKQGISMV